VDAMKKRAFPVLIAAGGLCGVTPAMAEVGVRVNAEFVARRRQKEVKDKNIKAGAVVVNSSMIDEGFNKAVKIIGDGCSSEVATLCGDIPLGQGRILGCLESNDSKPSSACKASIAQGKSTIESAPLGNANYFGASCGPDMARLCSDVTPGEGPGLSGSHPRRLCSGNRAGRNRIPTGQ
jgi:hypothetical protein